MSTDEEMTADAQAQVDALDAEAERFLAAAKPEPTDVDPTDSDEATMAMSAADLLDDDES